MDEKPLHKAFIQFDKSNSLIFNMFWAGNCCARTNVGPMPVPLSVATQENMVYWFAPQPQIDNDLHVLFLPWMKRFYNEMRNFICPFINFGGVFHPKGHNYVTDFFLTLFQPGLYAVGGDFEKEIILLSEMDCVMIRYTLVDAILLQRSA